MDRSHHTRRSAQRGDDDFRPVFQGQSHVLIGAGIAAMHDQIGRPRGWIATRCLE
jgi:hypothetical protein